MVATTTHFTDQTDWLRWLKSDMLPEADTLKALAHIGACQRCRAAYEDATAFEVGEFEAMIRERRPATGPVPAAQRRPASDAGEPPWRSTLVDWLDEKVRAALSTLRGARLEPAFLGDQGESGSEAEEWPLTEGSVTLPGGTEAGWSVWASRTPDRKHAISVRFSPASRPLVDGLTCTLVSGDFASDGGPRHGPVRLDEEIASGRADFPAADFPFLVGGSWLSTEIPAIRIELSGPA